MSAKNNKVDYTDKNQSANQEVDKSKRSFAKIGAIAPVIMTLASKTALGETPYYCTVSGQQSGNQSGSNDATPSCGVGYSPGAWKTVGLNGDGNLGEWLSMDLSPFTIDSSHIGTVKGVFQVNGTPLWQDPDTKLQGSGGVTAAKFYTEINGKFGPNKSAAKVDAFSTTLSLHDILMTLPGTLLFHVVCDYLNAALNVKTHQFDPVYSDITPQYIIDAYNNGATQAYFESLHH